MSNTIYYHKCNDCLTPFSSPEKHIDFCDCDGTVSFMGVVQGEKYVMTGLRPACDGRCTHAHGPSCDCVCLGANHGTGRTVTTVIREGKVHVVDPSKDIADDMARGYKYRDLKKYVEDMVLAIFGSFDEYVRNHYRTDRAKANLAFNAKQELDKALQSKVYDKRHKMLLEFATKYHNLMPSKE